MTKRPLNSWTSEKRAKIPIKLRKIAKISINPKKKELELPTKNPEKSGILEVLALFLCLWLFFFGFLAFFFGFVGILALFFDLSGIFALFLEFFGILAFFFQIFKDFGDFIWIFRKKFCPTKNLASLTRWRLRGTGLVKSHSLSKFLVISIIQVSIFL